MHTGLTARHHYVSQDQVNRLSTANDFERTMRIGRRNHAVAEVVQHFNDQRQHPRVVLDEQDCSRSCGRRDEKLIDSNLLAERLGGGRQVDRQACTNSHTTRERDEAAKVPALKIYDPAAPSLTRESERARPPVERNAERTR